MIKEKKIILTKEKEIKAKSQAFLLSLTLTLVSYASLDARFKDELLKITKRLPGKRTKKSTSPRLGTTMLLPCGFDQAKEQAEWVIRQCREKRLPGARQAADYLSGWAEAQKASDPKQVVIGVVGLAWPGVTLGVLHPKKKKLKMMVRNDLIQEPDLKLSELINQASASIIKQALVQADGDVRKLDPDMSDWLFGERKLDFYQADEAGLKAVHGELKKQGIIGSVQKEKDRIAVLATVPMVNEELLFNEWGLEKIEL